MLTSTVRTTADYLQEMTAGMMRKRFEYQDDLNPISLSGCLILSLRPTQPRKAGTWWLAPPNSARRCSPPQVPAPVLLLPAGPAGRTSWQSWGCRWCTCRARRRSWSTTLTTVLTRPWRTGSGQSCSVWCCVSYFVTRVKYFKSLILVHYEEWSAKQIFVQGELLYFICHLLSIFLFSFIK